MLFVKLSLMLFLRLSLFCSSRTSPRDSGSLQFIVSGSAVQSRAPTNIETPKMQGGTHVIFDPRLAMKGAIMEPTLANVEHEPIPTLRTKVG